ncbi:uncharacterized protein LOC109709956 isoform X2 [Ananas comosus]|uniref:Uncharacterized protein LOC109709956 isoform X2 n=1 Tax=Ananas comosus TaxID=4615 RepID=A0A6P5EVY7_ANACO|nr:uncharacterized protein LOC109709956 isoform X2 [Ananas comosus]
MHNGSSPQPFTSLLELGIDNPSKPSFSTLPYHHGYYTTLPSCKEEEGVMFPLHAFTLLSSLLLTIHFFSFLLIKFFTFLNHKTISKDNRDVQFKTTQDVEECMYKTDESSAKDDLAAADGGGEEGFFFWYFENAFEDSILGRQGKDSNKENSLEVEDDAFVVESFYTSPQEDLADVKHGTKDNNDLLTNVLTPSDCPSPIVPTCENVACEDTNKEESCNNSDETKIFGAEEARYLINNPSKLDSKKFRFDDGHEEKENCGGSLTGESTSKSSMEWRSSTIMKDSETEYPFSSSSRRSSSNWESYTLFRKYDEEMIYFGRISAQKLTETESFRSLRYQPRSISRRIVHKLTTKHKNFTMGGRNPYQELENAYVAQICLTWEALNWNYNYFRRKNADKEMASSCCPARVAQEFQQFQVLLQRFIENEPYELGRRPEIFARVRFSSPRLLLVPEFREMDEEGKEGTVSYAEFLTILEGAIRTFMDFLKADKQNHCEKLKAFIRKKSSSIDRTLLNLLKKTNKKKKIRLKDLTKRRRCIKRRRIKEEEEIETLMGLIDMKVVSRVLRMAEITEEQLHWCEEKMTKVRIWNGKTQRDPSPLFFPGVV